MIPAVIVLAYLATVLYIGIFAFRHAKGGAEDFFLAGRALGPIVFLASLFGTNMTAFTILGSSGHAFNNGIVTYGLMASSSALVIPLTLFLIGTRVWALGKRYGFMTPVQMFRDRWECGHIGTAIFALQAALLVPYIVIAVMGGGTALRAISGGAVPYWLGGAIVSVVVMSYVFLGGMRGTALVNTFQATLFLAFGTIALVVIGNAIGGFGPTVQSMLDSPSLAPLLTRERISPEYFFSYTFIPLSSIAFPHICIFCLTAKRMTHFRRTVIAYPLCIMAVWLPAVFLGVIANEAGDVPGVAAKLAARAAGTPLPSDDVVVLMLHHYAPVWLAGLLGAAIMAAVMASDSQILAMSTMFTEDVFAYYGGRERFGDAAHVTTGRVFVVLVTIAAYGIALVAQPGIFALAVQYGFSGFAALSPLLVAALFWKRSTKWGALAVALWTATTTIATGLAPPAWTIYGFLPVVPMVIGSSILMVVVSLLTPAPSAETIDRYFPAREAPFALRGSAR
ncbi:MAG: sodium:solute symporter family protein [Vicinamibacterales bacterium]